MSPTQSKASRVRLSNIDKTPSKVFAPSIINKPKKQIIKTPMDFLSHTPAEIEVEEEFINQETLPNQHQRFETLGFICIENVPDEQNMDETMAEKMKIKNYHFAPRSYNIKPKQMTKLNQKSDENAFLEKSLMSQVMHTARENVFKSRVGSINM